MPHTYHFAAPVLRLNNGMRMHYFPLPMEISDALQDAGVRRLILTLGGHTVKRAVQGRKDGERFIVLSRDLMRTLGVSYGEMLDVELRPDPEPDRVDLPKEFVEVLKQEPDAAERFYGFTPGKQRSLAHYVASAKRSGTRIKRALELAHKLKTYTLHGDRVEK